MGGFNPPHAALAEDRRGERCGKGARDASGGDREDGAQSSFSGIAVDVSLLNKVASKPGCSRSARDESGGCPLFWPGGVRHVGDVSPVRSSPGFPETYLSGIGGLRLEGSRVGLMLSGLPGCLVFVGRKPTESGLNAPRVVPSVDVAE